MKLMGGAMKLIGGGDLKLIGGASNRLLTHGDLRRHTTTLHSIALHTCKL